jgi:polyhydroxybutyrate depolymerase
MLYMFIKMKINPNHCFLFLLFLGSSQSIFAQNKEILEKDSLSIDGHYRLFEYYVPASLVNSASLVFVLHGSAGTINDARWQTNYEFEKLAKERNRQIIVYPQGYDRHWNDCRKNASYKANQENIDDNSFFNQMIAYFSTKFNIDEQAVFVTGISNGGQMCYKLAYEMPEKIKGIAPFVANLPEDFNSDCTPKNVAISVMIINGTADPINPNDGGWVVLKQDSTRGSVLSTAKSLEYWRGLLPEYAENEPIKYDDYTLEDESSIEHYSYFSKKTGQKVELVKVINGGHVVPMKDTEDLPENAKKFIGNKNRDINSPKLILDFFESLVNQ